MLELLDHLFAALCGQNVDHTWAPGGILLPCCQRCTGLYAGACVAALLHLWLRPKLTGRFLEAHGLFLLLVAPFCFHWLPQGPVLRTLTGTLFGFTAVTFLRLPYGDASPKPPHGRDVSPKRPSSVGHDRLTEPSLSRGWTYAIMLVCILIALPVLGEYGGQPGAYLLSAMVSAGAITLGALVLANCGLFLTEAASLLWRVAFERTRA